MKILIAEDDLTSRRVLEAVLKKSGYEVISTRTGKEAWEALQAEDSARLAFLDWMVPEMDGMKKNYPEYFKIQARKEKTDT